jgi:crotonobetainyl-CoA:carnitine CoA-transferase CaiB-like acyl-CoA transferase
MATRALEGLKVVDLAWVVAGPMVGRMLADCGAEVVRVESVKRVDTARMMGPFPGGQRDTNRSALFENCNAGKLGLALDMSMAEARDVILDLTAWGDVLIESFAPGQMAKWGLDYETLKARNPGLIMLSTSLMGQSGPMASLAGFGNVGAALSGFQALAGYPGFDPVGPFGPYTDYVGPRFAAAALLAAIDERARTGEGMHLDISQVEAGIQFLSVEFCNYFSDGVVATAMGNRAIDMAPHGVFRCAGEDAWVAIAVRDDAEWARCAGILGGDAHQERFAALPDRKRNEDELENLVAAWTIRHTAKQVEEQLQAAGIPAHVVASGADMIADPQLVHLGHFVRFPHEGGGDSIIEASRFRLADTPAEPRRIAPTPGRDTDHVLSTLLGYDESRIVALRQTGVLS